MGITKIKPRKTVADYMKLPEGARAELIEGEIFMSPSPRERHQAAVLNLLVALRRFLDEKRCGRIYAAPLDVHLPSGDIVQPDVLVVLPENQGIIQDWIRGVPDLLVEVISPESPERDRIVKRHLYEANGVREYWIVDPAAKTVEVFGLSSGSLVPTGFFEIQDVIRSPLLAGLALPAGDVFA